jgi:hypothetical protein
MKLHHRNEETKDKEIIDKIVRVYKKDLLHPELLAERFGVTAGTIQKYLKQNGIHDARDI